jgi:pimeloyl-ACP methyl ester carboxylesterase
MHEARVEGRVVGFMPATQRFARHSSSLGLRAIQIGAAPYFDLSTWAPRGDRAKKARAGVNQARRAGVSVTEVTKIDEKLVRESACLQKSWLTTRRSPIRFEWLFSVDLFQHKDRKKYFTARDTTGTLVGFLAASPIPARDGWYLEDVLRSRDAPNGTSDLLVVEVLELLKRDGAKLATLGTAPMAMEGAIDPEIQISPMLTRVVRFLASWFSLFYNFEGVRRFKAKFAPSWWENEYILVSQEITAPPRIISAFVKAIVPAGPSTLISRQVSRAWHRVKVSQRSKMSLSGNHGHVGEIDPAVLSRDDSCSYKKQSVRVDGLSLNYVSAGTGRPVVLIHGNPGSHEDYTLAMAGKLSESYHVIAFDRPGHGYSERSDSVETTVEVQAAIICDALRKLSIEKPVLVGHSWGGSLVLAAAVAYHNDLSGIVLLAPAAFPTVSIEWWSLLPHIPLFGKLFVKTLTPIIGRSLVKESLKEAYHPQHMHDAYAERSAEMWIQPAQISACAYDERTLRSSLKSISQHYSRIKMPVAIVTGSDDRILEPAKHAYPLQKAIKHSKLVVLPDTGHQLPQTRPEAVIFAINEVWREAEVRTATR